MDRRSGVLIAAANPGLLLKPDAGGFLLTRRASEVEDSVIAGTAR